MEILIIQTAFPGDLYLSLPLLKQIRRKFPQGKVRLMCRKGLGKMFLEHQIVDSVHEIEKGKSSSYKDTLKELRQIEFDWVFCPHRSYRTALFVWQLKKKVAVGYSLWWNAPFFQKRVLYNREIPDALRQLELFTCASEDFQKQWAQEPNKQRFLGVSQTEVVSFEDNPLPEWMSAEVTSWKPLKKRICLAPGSVWPTKKWPSSRYAELAKRFLESDYEVCLVGSAADSRDCELVAQADDRIQNLCGKTSLLELMEIFQESQLLISNDSGAMHVAAATSLPTVSIFGPTVPEFGYRPWQNRVRIVQEILSCRPCSPHGTKSCPIGTHACMNNLSSEKVFQSAMQLIGIGSSKGKRS